MGLCRRVLAKEWAITSACEAELTRLTEAGAQELKRCSLWAELQVGDGPTGRQHRRQQHGTPGRKAF